MVSASSDGCFSPSGEALASSWWRVNHPGGDATSALVLVFASVHGRWPQAVPNRPLPPDQGLHFFVDVAPAVGDWLWDRAGCGADVAPGQGMQRSSRSVVAAVDCGSALRTAIPTLIAISLWRHVGHPGMAVAVGLALFGVGLAINASIDSSMILTYADPEAVSLHVGFDSMANAAGDRWACRFSLDLFLVGDPQLCLWGSVLFVGLSWLTSLR